MANGYDCKEHAKVLERLKAIELNGIRIDEKIKNLEKEKDDMGDKLTKLFEEMTKIREDMAKLPLKIVIMTTSLTATITAIIIKLM